MKGVAAKVVVSLAALGASAHAFAQAYPAGRPITIIVPSAAGGLIDVMCRAMAEPLGQALKQRVLSNYTWDAVGAQTAEVYRQALALCGRQP